MNAHPELRSPTCSLRAAAAAALAALALVAAAPARAHAGHGEPSHGGLVAEAGVFQGELVARPDAVTLYVTNHGEQVSTAGATATMAVLVGTRKTEVVLAPAGGNRLAASGVGLVPAGAKVLTTVRLLDGRSGALRFELTK